MLWRAITAIIHELDAMLAVGSISNARTAMETTRRRRELFEAVENSGARRRYLRPPA